MDETQNKLNWLAFRYIADELDAAEASDFESRLVTDQQAREAVARAVQETTQIRQAFAAIEIFTAASYRSNWNRRATRVAAVAIGSCLTIFFAFFLLRSSAPFSGEVAHQTSEATSAISPAQLAYAWASARESLAELPPAANAELVDGLLAVSQSVTEPDAEQMLLAPSWMLAALAKMHGDIDLIDNQE